jgi:arabinan endo-1,5-alpha-L-arabinosidase
VLTEPAPSDDYVVETKVKVNFPTDDSCCFNYAQGGLVIYGNDGNYVKLTAVSIWNTRQTEFGNEVTPQPPGYPHYGNTVVGPVGDWTYLRVVRRGDNYTAFTSLDGEHWDKGGTWTHDLGSDAKIGLVSMGAAGFTSTFDYVRVAALAQ